MTTPNKIGNIAEAHILAALLRVGHQVLLPFGDGSKYDMVTDSDGTFNRVQCKNGRYKRGCVEFNTVSRLRDGSQVPYTAADIDAFAVYCAELSEVYWIPLSTPLAKGIASLRVEPTRNNQIKGILWARDFLI